MEGERYSWMQGRNGLNGQRLTVRRCCSPTRGWIGIALVGGNGNRIGSRGFQCGIDTLITDSHVPCEVLTAVIAFTVDGINNGVAVNGV